MLIERLRPASEKEREEVLGLLREAGSITRMIGATAAWMPWRRALAIRTLGWVGAAEAVPVLLERLSDRYRYVRESAARALGRIGDTRALPQLGELFRSTGRVGGGVAYDALVVFGAQAEPVFAGALRSQIESVRVASCFGVAALSEPETARNLLTPMLADDAGPVRAAAAEALGHVGGNAVPELLARATRDELPAVRAAATGALGFYDDPVAVRVAVNALLDPDRDTAVRAGEALVRLSRLAVAGSYAKRAIERPKVEWPVEHALIFASLGAL